MKLEKKTYLSWLKDIYNA